jgi:hypothetical protein
VNFLTNLIITTDIEKLTHILIFFQEFPHEGLASVVRNVFDFDSYSQEVKDMLVTTLHKHGIPIGTKPSSIAMGKE